ncbi:DUF5610 domain-containing protein [Echinimonas agarilytica]|uniref:DUF5610 domain-containing protein n=1 Tax=Echinimonas agarilytica TaxID=1215918 RepID=A0AA42B8T2_9GAMM|nr:DUF5610 domain-containing protein [Echinimonas agarilytica]MCM2681324.1 DUF5610 domain-containing protein [Echinimonas agarilytica]
MAITNLSDALRPAQATTGTPVSVREQATTEKNSAIMEAQLQVSIKSGNEPMSLLYKTALEAINAELEPTLGPNAAQSTYDSDLDVSPEATADRIVKGSTAFFDAFRGQNPQLNDEDAMTEFMSVIGGGIEKGFEEARDILDSLAVLEGDIKTNIDSTYDSVQSGLQTFVSNYFDGLAAAPEQPEPVA